MNIDFNYIKSNQSILALIKNSDKVLGELNYANHGISHVEYVSSETAKILSTLNFDERVVELGKIAGRLHDIGNIINRQHHGLSSANMAFHLLLQMGMPIDDICLVVSAIGYHEESSGAVVNEITAALILADKTDIRYTRVREGKYDESTLFEDMHDKVNSSIRQSLLRIDTERKIIIFQIIAESNFSISEFTLIYRKRMELCEKAALFLGYSFIVDTETFQTDSVQEL